MGRSALEDDDEVIACLLSKRELVMRGGEIAETLYAQVMRLFNDHYDSIAFGGPP